MSECDRCGDETDPVGSLPFAQYREEYGHNPVLCPVCRWELVRWIEADTDDGGDDGE